MRGGNEFWFLCDAFLRMFYPFLCGKIGGDAVQGSCVIIAKHIIPICGCVIRLPFFSFARAKESAVHLGRAF